MPAFDTLQPSGFNGITFPVRSCEVSGGLREHDHEYWRAPGADPEKGGRRLYEIKTSIVFAANFAAYQAPPLWPDRLATLRTLWEEGTTGPLVIPTIGIVQAFATNWVERNDGKQRSQVVVDVTWKEDQSALFLAADIVQESVSGLQAAAAAWGDVEGDVEPGLFAQVRSAIVAVEGVVDTVESYANLAADKFETLVGICEYIDATSKKLQNPSSWRALQALHDLWAAASKTVADIQGKGAAMKTYVTPRVLSVSQIATAIYGDSTRASDLMQLNPFDDPFAVPGGTTVRYYAET